MTAIGMLDQQTHQRLPITAAGAAAGQAQARQGQTQQQAGAQRLAACHRGEAAGALQHQASEQGSNQSGPDAQGDRQQQLQRLARHVLQHPEGEQPLAAQVAHERRHHTDKQAGPDQPDAEPIGELLRQEDHRHERGIEASGQPRGSGHGQTIARVQPLQQGRPAAFDRLCHRGADLHHRPLPAQGQQGHGRHRPEPQAMQGGPGSQEHLSLPWVLQAGHGLGDAGSGAIGPGPGLQHQQQRHHHHWRQRQQQADRLPVATEGGQQVQQLILGPIQEVQRQAGHPHGQAQQGEGKQRSQRGRLGALVLHQR